MELSSALREKVDDLVRRRMSKKRRAAADRVRQIAEELRQKAELLRGATQDLHADSGDDVVVVEDPERQVGPPQ